MIAIAEQSATGHINIIKGAVAVQNSIRGKGKFLRFPLVALYRNMLAVNTKGSCIPPPRLRVQLHRLSAQWLPRHLRLPQ